MVLTNPKVIGPISELTGPNGIRVQGQITNFTVKVFAFDPGASELIAEATARASDDRIPLLPNFVLRTGMRLYAMQEGDGDSSATPSGDNFETVQPPPGDPRHLNAVSFQSQVYRCALHLWTTGGYPGATVEVSTGSGNVLGSAPILEGYARIELNQGVPAVPTVALTQTVPTLGLRGTSMNIPTAVIPLAQGFPLPPPEVQLPLRGCDATMKLSGIMEGSQITITRASGLTETVGMGISAGEVVLSQPLKKGDKVKLSQTVWEKCERPSQFTEPPIPVGPADPVDPPSIFSPLCADTQILMLSGLRGNSIVSITNETQVIRLQTPPDPAKGTFSFPVPPLISGTISATQEICGVISLSSKLATVSKHNQHIDPPTIQQPLYGCARNVTLQGAHVGGTVRVYAVTSEGEFPISGIIFVDHSQLVVDVIPWLQSEWKGIRASQWACGGVAAETRLFRPIDKASVLPPVLREPVFEADTFVNVDGTIPGAHVELFITHKDGSRTWAGAAEASHISPTSIFIDSRASLIEGEKVEARQVLCPNSDGAGSAMSNTQAIQPAYLPRPFYIVGHNPNHLDEVREVLAAGGNAIEPDINIYSGSTQDILVISHFGFDFPFAQPITLVDYLIGLHDIAIEHPNLSLITFDCKPATATPDYGYEILMAIRTHLTRDIPIPIMLSVSSIDHGKIFKRIKDILSPREGLMIDEENDPGSVATFFDNLEVSNRCYGNGNLVQNPVFSPNIRYSIEWACGLRAGFGTLKFVYEWPSNDQDRWVEFIRTGVDGMITDDAAGLYRVAKTESSIRLATREDNPFKQPNSQYVIITSTGDIRGGGTDSHVTFTINGSGGSVSRQINTFLNGRMESGQTNFVTFHSPDLGEISSVTIVKDNAGNGPDWFLGNIGVYSVRYGVHKTATYANWIEDGPTYQIDF